jgi:predicted MFS family arabinose efflux permease
MTALGIPLLTFLPVFAKDVFHEGPGTFTLFMVCSGAGSIVGALTVAGLGNLKHKGRIALMMMIILGACITAFALSPAVPLSCVLIFFCGASIIAVFATISSLVQLITSDDMRGRVMSVYNVAFRGGMPMGQLVTGWLVQHYFSAPTVMAVNGLLLIVLAVYFLLGQRKVAAL